MEDSHNQFGVIKSDVFILQTPSLPKKVDKFKNYMRSSFKMTDEGVSCLLYCNCNVHNDVKTIALWQLCSYITIKEHYIIHPCILRYINNKVMFLCL